MGLLNWIFGGSNTKDAKAVSLEPAKKNAQQSQVHLHARDMSL